ncbi:MAG: hypothetical protein E6G94_07820 [Alphaproteobacteria bacterium]|nr:MAG: hypothetical protein E6G94_07820 [Alphaproteobacteria bacterium]
MAQAPRSVDDAIARFDEVVGRWDGRTSTNSAARRRYYGRAAKSVGKRLANIGVALAALIVATLIFAKIVGPIGLTGLFVVSFLTLAILLFFSVWGGNPAVPKRVAYSDDLPTTRVVQQLEGMLEQRRNALPAPAARRADAIASQLPLLESRLGELDALDPLAQDARRLMGKHLPDLLDRYERVPADYRREKDGDGLTVDDRLATSLDAAREALDDIAARLAQTDRDAFETQGRFIESRYKDGGPS